METVSQVQGTSSSRVQEDYFSFPLTETEALDEYRISDHVHALREEEKKLRQVASHAIKAVNANKKQIALLEKKERAINQKRRPQWYGVDLLTPAQQAEWNAHVTSGQIVTDEQFYLSRPSAILFCAKCASKPEHAGRPRVEIRRDMMFMSCGDCGDRWALKFAIVVSRAFVERKIAERLAKKNQPSLAAA